MSTKQDIELHEGENWKITLAAHYADGSTMPLDSGSDVEFRISDEEVVILTQSVGNGVEITDVMNGFAEIVLTAEEQEHHGISSAGVYLYEIRVTKGDEFYIQAEGRLKVERSLFGETLDPLLSDFMIRFPEFTEDDNIISLYLKDAARVVDAETFWSDADRPIAKVYLAAHYLHMRLSAKIAYESAGTGTGEVRIIRVEDRSVVFDTSKGAQAGKSGLTQTFYGQQYLAMRFKYPQWMLRA